MKYTRPDDHKLGINHHAAFRILLSGHTLWHTIVGCARKGQVWTLVPNLYRMRNLIDQSIALLGESVEPDNEKSEASNQDVSLDDLYF